MEQALNPFTPGSGLKPAALVGRDAEVAAMDALIKRTSAGMVGRPIILNGLRGVGKTVLLNQLKYAAEEADWLTIKFEAAQGERGAEQARRSIANGLAKGSLKYKARKGASEFTRTMLGLVGAFNASLKMNSIELGISPDSLPPMTGVLELDLMDVSIGVAESLQKDGLGFAIFIDEMQDLDSELMEALLSTQHELGQRGLPFYIIGAGLPSLPGIVAEHKSYAERLFDFKTIGRLDESELEKAFVEPVAAQGAAFMDDALATVCNASGGYPYFVQEFGSEVWRLAAASPFTERDAGLAVETGTAKLDHGFFMARWDRATPGEREYLVAMAHDKQGPSSSKEVAERLGKKPSSTGGVRKKLIDKGLVYSPEFGKIAFTVPSFHLFIERRADVEGLV